MGRGVGSGGSGVGVDSDGGLVGVFATATSVLLVRRRLDRLDLIGVLKTRE